MIGHYLDWLNMGWPNMQALADTPNAPTYTTPFWEWFDRWVELDEAERQGILDWHRQFTDVCQSPAFVAQMKAAFDSIERGEYWAYTLDTETGVLSEPVPGPGIEAVDDGWNRPAPKRARRAVMHARYKGRGKPSTKEQGDG